jgi:Protein of unknown function (DUF3667)
MVSPLVSSDLVDSPPELPRLALLCANCGAELHGKYCAACGQRHDPHIHDVAHFAGEAVESISHADSRLWRTLLYLLSRPGFLTREFFAGRRISYLPPFRLYLVISVVFFLVVGLPEGQALRLDGDNQPDRIAKLRVASPASEYQSAIEFCDQFRGTGAGAGKPASRLHTACTRIIEDGGTELSKSVVHNIPRAMFVFLPLLAMVMWLLYWRPRHYYVEHLLFLIHNHAFVFLVLSITALLGLIPVVGPHLGPLEFAAWLYMIWYLFRAMRNFYGQGRALTLAKYLAIGTAYFSAGVVVLLVTALYSALTIAP